MDHNDKNMRACINGYLNKPDNEPFKFSDKEEIYLIQEKAIQYLDSMENFKEFKNKFNELTNSYRNDINHASFGRKGQVPDMFFRKLNEFYKYFKDYFYAPQYL